MRSPLLPCLLQACCGAILACCTSNDWLTSPGGGAEGEGGWLACGRSTASAAESSAISMLITVPPSLSELMALLRLARMDSGAIKQPPIIPCPKETPPVRP